MKTLKNIKIDGLHGKPILLDTYYRRTGNAKPVVIFAHGFKGFKDWGHWHLIAKEFAEAGFVFVKFNFSHNGTTPEQPIDFADLEAFGKDTFTIELDDLGKVVEWVQNTPSQIPDTELNSDQIFLIGHSRGGGIVLLKASQDSAVKKVVTWASVHDFGDRWGQEQLDEWKKEGVRYIENARTKQQMPLYYDIVKDYFTNIHRLHIPNAVKTLDIPYLAIHGTADEAVSIASAKKLTNWVQNSQLVEIEGAGHTFGGQHPFDKDSLPTHSQELVKQTIEFLKF